MGGDNRVWLSVLRAATEAAEQAEAPPEPAEPQHPGIVDAERLRKQAIKFSPPLLGPIPEVPGEAPFMPLLARR